MFQILNRVEAVFERFCYILLDILSAGTGVCCYHDDVVGVDVREEIDRQLCQRENTEYRDCNEYENRCNRIIDGCFIDILFLNLLSFD